MVAALSAPAVVCHQARFQALGGPNEILIYHHDDNLARQALSSSIAEVRRIEMKYSRYRSNSVLSQINADAGIQPTPIDTETAKLLAFADEAYRESDRLFDITSGILRQAWNFKERRVPEQSELDPLLELISWEQVRFNESKVFLPREKMELDFGGFGKEYAVDRVAGLLKSQGIESALINFAGDVATIGKHPEGRPWTTGVVHPRDPGRCLKQIPLVDKSIATSGDYERFFEVDGKRYGHLLNPKTGWPVQELQSVTVLHESCLLAGVSATIAMLKGETEGTSYLKEFGADFLMVASGSVRENLSAETRALLKL